MKLEDGLRSVGKMQPRKMTKEQKAEQWMSINVIPDNLKHEIMPYVCAKLQDNDDVDLMTMLSILPRKLATSVKKQLCFPVLKKVSHSSSL